MRVELLAGQDGRHQVEPEVADVAALAGAGRRSLDRAEHVHELVHGHHGPQRVARVGAARVEVDDRHAGQPEARARPLTADALVAGLAGRAVEVDEVGLLSLVEARLVGKLPAELLEGDADPADRARQQHVRDVERAERARAARSGEEVEARRPRRILAPPPGVERGRVADDPRRELGEAVRRAGRANVGDVHGVCRGHVGQPVDAGRSRPAPGNRRRGVRGHGRDERDEGRQRREPELHAGHGTRREEPGKNSS